MAFIVQYGEDLKETAEKYNVYKYYKRIKAKLAEIYEILGKKDKQVELLLTNMEEKEKRHKFSKTNNIRHLAESAWKANFYPEAEKSYLKLLEIEQGNPKYSNTIMDTYFHLGLIKKATKEYDDAIYYLKQALNLCEEHKPEDTDTLRKYKKTLEMTINEKRKHMGSSLSGE